MPWESNLDDMLTDPLWTRRSPLSECWSCMANGMSLKREVATTSNGPMLFRHDCVTSPGRYTDAVMNRTMFKSKIHRATVTHADLHYVGSVTVDLDLLDAADILPGELVSIVDVTNGARLETYTIAGERGSGVIGINGAAAHLVKENDTVILITYAEMTTEEAKAYEPRVVHVDRNNLVIQLGNDPAEGLTPGLLRPPFTLHNVEL